KVVDTVSSFLHRARKGDNASANPTQVPAKDANTLSPHSTASGAPFPLSTSDQAEAAMNLGDDDLWLSCVIEGETEVFPIDIEGSLWRNPKFTVGYLKEKIQEKRKDGSLAGVDAHSLVLWKGRAIEEESGEELESADSVLTVFLDQPPLDRLHIIVRKPDTANISSSSSNESNASSVPSISNNWSPRHDTVSRLYRILREEKLVQVRGTPGCGKTTLMNLLHSYIHKKLPSAFVNTQESWPPKESGPSQQQRLRQVDPAFPRPDGLAFLLFDEGQDSYDDHLFWNGFLKGVGDGFYPWYHVILFCSYGSPSSHPVPHDIGTPLALCDAARISLWPQEGLEELIGILFKCSEFDEVVSQFEHRLSLHPDLLDLIFDWTVGHAGAVVEILRMISYQASLPSKSLFTVEAFHDETPTHALVQNLCHGAFERGLPMAKELSAQPDMAALFRNLLKNGVVDRNEDNDEDEATHKCHCHGWIHANPTVDLEIVRYSFPSPLHT
ncbi:hypothetical protein L208DRAFT_1412870, partial [Tricholoma matsutake]